MQVNKDAEGLRNIQLLSDVSRKAVQFIISSTSMTMSEKQEFIDWAINRLKEAGIKL